MVWETIIGLEVHAQLKTQSKLFSGAAISFGALPNSQTSFIDAGLPGTLPVLNHHAVIMAIQFGLAIEAKINNGSYFERKNYFYADLPKGYQISQFARPIVSDGQLRVLLSDGAEKKVPIMRAHLEEDAGKSLHEAKSLCTGIDLNRAGTPLLEIVTSPCFYSSEEAIAYLKTLHQLVRFLGICDGNMQEGSFRCDINISLRPKGTTTLGTRTEIKNLNSFRFIEKAIAYEQQRHQQLLESGEKIFQETRLFCPTTESTQILRTKENENDYRYFPDPDLLPIYISDNEIAKAKLAMPPLPRAIISSLRQNKEINEEDIYFLLSSPACYQFFRAVKKHGTASDKLIINWLKGNYAAALNEDKLSFENPPLSARRLASLLDHISNNNISGKIAKQLFAKLWNSEESVEEIMQREGYQSLNNDQALEAIVLEVIAQNPQQLAQYRAGKEKLLAFFVGQVMKQTKGQADPQKVSCLFNKHLMYPKNK